MIRRVAFLSILSLLGWSLRGEQVAVTRVEGSVEFCADGHLEPQPVVVGQHLGAGTFTTGQEGGIDLTTFEGSSLRLGESAALHYDATDGICMVANGTGRRSTFHLLRGRLEVAIRFPTTPPHCYHVYLPHGEASVPRGECVMCQHGGNTYFYVAEGPTTVWGDPPPQSFSPPDPAVMNPGPPASDGSPPVPESHRLAQILVGNGRVGMLSIDGLLRVVPLATVATATQQCLLSGFNSSMGTTGCTTGRF